LAKLLFLTVTCCIYSFTGKIMFLEKDKNASERTGWIEVVCGSMFSGKTEELIRRLNRARIANQ
jgi:hypothetical protein